MKTAVERTSSALNASRSIHVDVLGLADQAWQEEKNTWQGGPAKAFPVHGPKALGYSPKLRHALHSSSSEVIHSHGLWCHTSADVASWNSKYSNNPYVVSPHGMLDSWALSRASIKKRIARWLYEDKHLARASCIHALCQSEAIAIRAFGLTNPICVVPNGLSLPECRHTTKPPWQADFEPHNPVLLFLGRLHPKKNIHGLLSAIAQIKRNGKLRDWRVAIAGWDQVGYLEQLRRQVKSLDLNREVRFLGAIHGTHKDAALRFAAAYVLPSFSEGFPISVLEAWAYARPVAMTSACNIPEGFTMGAAHQIAPNPNEMSQDLQEFLHLGHSKLTSMGQNGRQLIAERFSLDATALQFSQLYEWVNSRGPRPNFVQL
ncbi:MAG: glycosyltransferase [Hyphomicrobiaceae bacterium]